MRFRVAILLLVTVVASAEQIPSVRVDTPFPEPPTWALLGRQLIDLMNRTPEVLLQKYVRPNGEIKWPPREEGFQSIDTLDDAYESFHNWPLFYALGGHEKFLKYAKAEFEAITNQFSRYPTGKGCQMVVKEYQPGYDWFHQGEGNYLFYMLSMADPGDQRTRERARRFAGLFMLGAREKGKPVHSKVTVGNRFLRVSLAPGAGADLRLGIKRFARQPTYTLPWKQN